MAKRLGEQAVVIGGSIAGLLTARILVEHFERVTILERDPVGNSPAVHKSVPQGHHLHTLLLGGLRVLSALYPDFTTRLEAMGAVPVTMTLDFPVYRPEGVAYSLSGTVKEPRDLGLRLYSQSRALLEQCIRQCTLDEPRVVTESDAPVNELVHVGGRVTGVRYGVGGHELAADLVVDCGGRGSQAARWLKEMDFQVPEQTEIGVDFAYSSTKFHMPNYDGELGRYALCGGPPPKYLRGAALVQIEDDLWQVSLAGRFGDYPPLDETGFMAFARELPSPRLYPILRDAERVSEISHHRFPRSLWRHYERLTSFPERLLVLGDAISSFNPVYGQGMSSAALQAQELARLLAERSDAPQPLQGLAAHFFPMAAQAVSTPWLLAANLDFSYPQTTGERPLMAPGGQRYFVILDALTAEDPELHKIVMEVFHLARPLSALWEEPVRTRVFERMGKNARG